MAIVMPTAAMMARMTLADLKEVHAVVQRELQRRREIGDRKMVERTMALAAGLGWDPTKGDALRFIEQLLNKGETNGQGHRNDGHQGKDS